MIKFKCFFGFHDDEIIKIAPTNMIYDSSVSHKRPIKAETPVILKCKDCGKIRHKIFEGSFN